MANLTGKQLAMLLARDGWVVGRRTTHGIFFSKRFPDELMPRSTVVPDKSDALPNGTLGAILGVRQTGLGKAGLDALMAKYGPL